MRTNTLGLGVAFAIGVCVGLAINGLVTDRRSAPERTTGPASDRPHDAPRTSDLAGARPRVATAASIGSAPAGDVPASASTPAAPTMSTADTNDDLAWIDVHVRTAEGAVVTSGTTYALAAGARSPDDASAIPTGEIGRRLAIVGHGFFDVGVRTDLGCALARDVEARRGDTTRVDLVLPVARPIEFRLEGRMPTGPDSSLRTILVSAWPMERGLYLPGRDEPSAIAAMFDLDADGRGATAPLPAGRYAITASLREISTATESLDPLIEPFPRIASPGDAVTLKTVETGLLRLHWERDVKSWPDVALTVTVVVRDGDRAAVRELRTHRPDGMYDNGSRSAFPVTSGHARIDWSGAGILPGSLSLDVPVGTVVERTMPVEFDAAKDFGPVGNVTVHVDGASPNAVCLLAGLRRMGEADAPNREPLARWGEIEADGTATLLCNWQGATSVVAVAGTSLASAPTSVVDGSLSIVLRPAGLLLATNDRVYPEGTGEFTVSLPDGRPIPYFESTATDETPEHADVRVRVQPARVLGPLPVGRYRFQVRIGGRSLPDVEATVVAGRIGLLRIRTE